MTNCCPQKRGSLASAAHADQCFFRERLRHGLCCSFGLGPQATALLFTVTVCVRRVFTFYGSIAEILKSRLHCVRG